MMQNKYNEAFNPYDLNHVAKLKKKQMEKPLEKQSITKQFEEEINDYVYYSEELHPNIGGVQNAAKACEEIHKKKMKAVLQKISLSGGYRGESKRQIILQNIAKEIGVEL